MGTLRERLELLAGDDYGRMCAIRGARLALEAVKEAINDEAQVPTHGCDGGAACCHHWDAYVIPVNLLASLSTEGGRT
jgi:hypothetical protein